MQRPIRMRVLVIAFVSACGFAIATMDPPEQDDVGTGGDIPADAYVPDAGPCQSLITECAGTTLRTCKNEGSLPTDLPCAWGCSSLGAAHCAKLQPHGGAVTEADLEPLEGLQNVTIDNRTINTETGEISGMRTGVVGLAAGIDFHVRNGAGIFRFDKLTLQGQVRLVGNNAAALVSITTIDSASEIDVTGGCNGTNRGPGGQPGGDKQQNGSGPSGGAAGTGDNNACKGGGGGGYGAAGGVGGGATNAGGTSGDSLISALVGGGGGGGGGGTNGGKGGGGGGAIQLVANGTIRIEGLGLLGGINAGGCGGESGDACAGGGGAGGTILIEAPIIELANSILAVNGGGGGGSKNGTAGQDARLSSSRASGGTAGTGGGGGPGPGPASTKGGDGGAGGARGAMTGQAGETKDLSGAGGGGVGRIRFYTYSGSVTVNNGTTLSPSFTDTNTSTTRGVADVR
jgi:hypothetical protein